MKRGSSANSRAIHFDNSSLHDGLAMDSKHGEFAGIMLAAQ
jgi:hypothetical protein